jgi:glycerol-3-phosphate acyltransferase PlsY
MIRWVLAAAAAFALGSLPWGFWIGRWARGIDVREHGSGNLGATNVYRLLGPWWGIAVLLLDAAKGAAAVWAARSVVGIVGDPAASWAGLLGMAGAVAGHTLTPFAGFHGGKGVASAAGAWCLLAPWPLAVCLALFALVFALTRIVSAGSLAAAVALAPAVALLDPRQTALLADPVFWSAVLTSALIVLRHRANLERLVRRQEKPLDLRGPRATTRGR